MHIEINAGGLGAGSAVAEYQWNMADFISDAESVISSFKAVNSKAYDLNGGVGSLQSAVDAVSERIRQEEEKKAAAVTVQKKSNDFLDLAIRVDKQVAILVDQNRDEFYKTNPWLKPAVSTDDIAWYGNIWNWLDETARKAWDGAVKIYEYLLDSYNNHGWVYYTVQGGKIVFNVAKAVVKIIGAVGACSTGVGIPIAILGIISAGNDIINACTDGAYIYTKQYDMVGKTNKLKDTLVNNAGELGVLLGNEQLGEKIGALVYYGIDLVSFLDGADDLMKSFGKLNVDIYGQYSPGSFIWGDVGFDDVFDNKYDNFIDFTFEELPQFKLEGIIKGTILGIDPDSTIGLISDVLDGIHDVYDSGSDLMENMLKVLVR